ncbi:MAG: glycoside hydrolase family 3 C-terminal domain-containing protein [Lachnospiraceae bacterium]|nr:glycoside hydrolase family 3 C-terminal domain-containing protein [Lachnospiraceae bacterium]
MKRDLSIHRQIAASAVKKLSFEEKLMAFAGTAAEMEKIGLPRFWIGGEGSHGVQARNDQAGELGKPAYTTLFPNPIGMASSRDKELLRAIGRVVGTEARSLYNDRKNGSLCIWAPTVDMERDPRWGRNEEGYGEDPHLTSRMAGEYILGMAGEDPDYVLCGATLKHFYGNNVEKNRVTADSKISQQMQDDYYIRVFRETIEYATPLAAMSSYNMVNGLPSTVNPQLRNLLKKWGLTHIVSDAGALTNTVEPQRIVSKESQGAALAIKAGVDYFPDAVAGDNMHQRNAVREAIKEGLMTEEDLDASLTDKLTAYSVLGLFEDPLLPPSPYTKDTYNITKVDTKESRALARSAAGACSVLLKNEGGTLPLQKDQSVLLLGPFADRCPLDWYSGFTTKMVTLKDAISEQPDQSITAGEGLYPAVRIRLSGDTYAGLQEDKLIPVSRDQAETFRIMLWDSSRITFRCESSGKLLSTDGELSEKENGGKEPVIHQGPLECFSWFFCEAFETYDKDGNTIYFEEDNALHFWEDARICGIKNRAGKLPLTFETVTCAEEILEKQPSAEVVVAAFGLHPIINCKEDWDRTSIRMPVFQQALLDLICEKYEKTVLLLAANAPIAVKKQQESSRIPAILWAALGSEEYGNGLWDVIFGRISPCGRLPQTWYADDEQLGDMEEYDIRKNKMTYLYFDQTPLYPFGYGLTYTSFEKEILGTEPDEEGHESVTVRIKNTGKAASDEVAEVYRDREGRLYLWEDARPLDCPLAGFAKIKDIKPGQECIARISL